MAASRVGKPIIKRRPTDYFNSADERAHDIRLRNADLGETACAEVAWIKKLLDSFC
jgi:hypothetical protein